MEFDKKPFPELLNLPPGVIHCSTLLHTRQLNINKCLSSLKLSLRWPLISNADSITVSKRAYLRVVDLFVIVSGSVQVE
jgi:hypothetical protein